MFADRRQAGRMLTERIPDVDRKSSVVIALPRGGVPVAAEIALAFGLPLDIVLVRKVGVPGHPELALGAISDGDEMDLVLNPDIAAALGLDPDEARSLARKSLPELERRRKLYSGGRPPVPVADKTVIVVDDGLATGATMRAALRVLRRRGAKRLIVALPVAPAESISELRQLCDAVVCLATPSPFMAVGAHYAAFNQVDDSEVIRILRQLDSRADLGQAAAPGSPGPPS